MRVMDKDVSEKDRAEIQETMLGPKVLDSSQFPEIRFRSTIGEPAGEGRWRVAGDLTLHGQTRPVKLEVQAKNGHYQGAAQLKQKGLRNRTHQRWGWGGAGEERIEGGV